MAVNINTHNDRATVARNLSTIASVTACIAALVKGAGKDHASMDDEEKADYDAALQRIGNIALKADKKRKAFHDAPSYRAWHNAAQQYVQAVEAALAARHASEDMIVEAAILALVGKVNKANKNLQAAIL